MSDIEFTVTPEDEQPKKQMGALNVRLSLKELQRALRLKDNVRLVYAGDFDYMTQGIKLTFVGEDLPIPQEECIPDDGWIMITVDEKENVVSAELAQKQFWK